MNLQLLAYLTSVIAAISLGWIIKGWQTEYLVERKNSEIAHIHQQYDKERLHAQEQLTLAMQNNRQAEQQLQVVADQERIKANEQINTASRRADALVVRVRNAEAAAATSRLVSAAIKTSCAGQAPARSDGPELLNSLGIEDVQEAERADKIRIALGACYTQYYEARAKD